MVKVQVSKNLQYRSHALRYYANRDEASVGLAWMEQKLSVRSLDRRTMWIFISGLTDLHNHLCSNRDDTDFIGVTIASERFSCGPIWFSFRPIHNFHVDDLWSMLYSAAQSNVGFDIDDTLSINYAIVQGVMGSGRVRLTSDSVFKRSILTIRNDDNLCLPRSLVTALAYVVRGQIRSGQLHEYWNNITRGKNRTQTTAALDLINCAGVNVPSAGCGYNEIIIFQEHLATHGIAVVVYTFQNFGRGDLPLYNGTRYVIDIYKSVLYTLNIMYYESVRHFQPILNLVGASGSRGYCVPCYKSYRNAEDHRCSNRCYKCMNTQPCDVKHAFKKCNDCFRSFFGNLCFENHLKTKLFKKNLSVCKALRICQICHKTVRSYNRKEKHECGVSFCQICNERLPLGHFCFIQPLERKKEKSKTVFLFYDFETQQSLGVLGDEEKKYTSRIYVWCSRCAATVSVISTLRTTVNSAVFENTSSKLILSKKSLNSL